MNKEIENKMESENIKIEYPKNYQDIIDFKLKRLEKEYEETINKNFSIEDLENNNDFDSDSEDQQENEINTGNNNNQYQCLDGEEFVEIFENEENNQNSENLTDNNEDKFNKYIDPKKFEEFVKISDGILLNNDNLNNIPMEDNKEIKLKYNETNKIPIENINVNFNNVEIENFEFYENNEKNKPRIEEKENKNTNFITIKPIEDPERIKNAMKNIKIKPPLWARK